MQAISDLWKTTIGKLAIIGGGGIAGLISLCFVCTICSALVGSDETAQDVVSQPTEVVVKTLPAQIVDAEPTVTPTEPFPTETPTSLPPTETSVPTATEAPPTEIPPTEVLEAVILAGDSNINLRSGPGTEYEAVGMLASGGSLKVVGRNADSTWWQVSAPEGLAWVADSVVTANNVDDSIPIVEAPSLSIQPTQTPLPVPTEPPPQPQPTEPPVSSGSTNPTFSNEEVSPPWWPCAEGQIKGNRDSMIYHQPGGQFYAKTYEGVDCYNSAAEAETAGFRASKR